MLPLTASSVHIVARHVARQVLLCVIAGIAIAIAIAAVVERKVCGKLSSIGVSFQFLRLSKRVGWGRVAFDEMSQRVMLLAAVDSGPLSIHPPIVKIGVVGVRI